MPAADVTVVEDGDVRIVQIGPMGPFGNNAYIVRDVAAGESLLVDMPLDTGPLLDAMASEAEVRAIVATHWHPDHWASYEAVRAATSAPVIVGRKEINIPAERIDRRVDDGDELRAGGIRLEVMHTPGHTPGSITLRVGRALITGDTLFKGGPGRTFAAGDLETILAAIEARLLPLPEETVVLPGHGERTDIAESRRGFTAYRGHAKPEGFHGDVTWD